MKIPSKTGSYFAFPVKYKPHDLIHVSFFACMYVCMYVFDILTMAFPIKQRKASVHIEWNIFQLHIFTAILRHFFRHDITHRVSSYWTNWGLAFSYYYCCVVAAAVIGKFHFFLYEFLSLEIKTQDLLCKFTFFWKIFSLNAILLFSSRFSTCFRVRLAACSSVWPLKTVYKNFSVVADFEVAQSHSHQTKMANNNNN